jgi:hypothetical protein
MLVLWPMKARIDIGLDLDGLHTFRWEPARGGSGVDVPASTLERWTAEREAVKLACLRWKRVVEEIEETLYRADAGERPAAQHS